MKRTAKTPTTSPGMILRIGVTRFSVRDGVGMEVVEVGVVVVAVVGFSDVHDVSPLGFCA